MPFIRAHRPALFELAMGGVTATVSSRGGALVAADVDGVAIVEPTVTTHTGPGAAGLVLAPWVNRVEGACWEHDGIVHRLEVTEPATGHAIHGLLATRDLELRERAPGRVVLGCLIDGAPGYPFRVDVEVAYRTSADGIRVDITAVNESASAAPFAAGHHPYLRIGDVPTAELVIRIDGDVELDFDETCIPRGRRDVTGTAADPRAGAVVGEGDRHTCYAASAPTGSLAHRLEAPDGTRLELRADAAMRWTQLYVAPALATDEGPRRAIAVEPMSAPPNALRTGESLAWIAPGQRWSAGFEIRLAR